jgi:predicted nucleotidyltransferase
MVQNELNKKVLDRFPKDTILIGYRGSVAHNLYVPPEDENGTDDIDLMGVFIGPPERYIGLHNSKETVESFVDEYDIVSYEFKKFIKLLLNCNPNVLSLLFLNKEHYLKTSLYSSYLLFKKQCFLSKKAYKSYTGYASGQLKRMEAYKTEGYMGQKRKGLIDKYGFDTKNASHCIRLLKMGIELLETGQLNVYRRGDVQELLDIKNGKWNLGEVKEKASRLFELAKKARDKTELPDEPNYEEIHKLVERTIYNYIENNYDKG